MQLLLAYVSTLRSEGLEVDKEMAAKDATALYKAGEKKLGTDEKTFISIISSRSRVQLIAISSAYREMYKKTLKKVKSPNSVLLTQLFRWPRFLTEYMNFRLWRMKHLDFLRKPFWQYYAARRILENISQR